MNDHYHYGYADERHSHRGDYADERHDHGLDYAELHHRHYDLEREDDQQQQHIRELREVLSQLSNELATAFTRIGELEDTVREHQMAVPHAEAAR